MSDQTQDVGEMEAGMAMDERVCKALGIPGTVQYFASDNGGETGYLFSHYRREVEDFIADYRQRLPGSAPARCEVCESVVYPRVSEEIAAAWQAVGRMRARGYAVFVGGRPDAWEVEIVGPGGESWRNDDQPTAPLAISRAVLMVAADRPDFD